jgi:hypothetical protein
MRDHTVRAIAYIVARMAGKQKLSTIYDQSLSKHFSFGGEFSEENVLIYDHDQKCHISGSGSAGSYSLYHFGNGKHISLKVGENGFEGYDHDSGTRFSGSIEGGSVSINDREGPKTFEI